MFSASLTVLRLITTVWPEMTENTYFRDFSAQVSQIFFFILFNRFTAYYNCMTWNVRKLISPRFQCTSITNRFLSLVDRFTAYYNCMTWNVRKLIPPRFQCTSITNSFLCLLDRFTAYYNSMSWNLYKTRISAISVHKYHKSCSLLLWPFYGLLLQYDLKW